MRKILDGSENGRPRRKRSWIKLKIAVFALIPIASVSTARRLKAGVFRSCRSTKRISSNIEVSGRRISFGSECDDWVDTRGTAGWHAASDQRDANENKSCAEK